MTEKKVLYYASPSQTALTDTKAQIYGPCIAKVIDKNGGVANTQMIVDEAKSDKSPLHEWFEWDNTKAANEHRKYQARQLIKGIEIEVIENDKSSQIVRAFHYVERGENENITKGFAKFEVIQQNPDEYNEFILEAYLRRIRELNSKYRRYKELRPLTEAIDNILEKHKELVKDAR